MGRLEEFYERFNKAQNLSRNRKYEQAMMELDCILAEYKDIEPVHLSQVYVTYVACSQEHHMFGFKNNPNRVKEIDYLNKALICKPDNKVAPRTLFQVLLEDKSKFIDAMETLALYNINLNDFSETQGLSTFNRELEKKGVELIYACVLTLCTEIYETNPNVINQLYDIHEKYPSSIGYTDILYQCSLACGENLKSYSLIKDLLHSVENHKMTIKSYFSLLNHQLLIVSMVGSKEEVKAALAETEVYLEKHKNDIRDERLIYSSYTNKAAALLRLEELEKLIELYNSLKGEGLENTFLYDIAECYRRKKQYSEAIRLGLAACNLKSDEMDYMLLAKAHMGLGDYATAVDYLEKGISFLSSDQKQEYEFKDIPFTARNLSDKNEQLAEYYKFLMQAFVGNKDFKSAKAVELIAEEDDRINTLNDILDSSIILGIEGALNDSLEVVQSEKEEIEEKLRSKTIEVSAFKRHISNWYKKLVGIQVLNHEDEITDAEWEEQYERAFDKIIKSVSNYCINTQSVIEKINNRISVEFPYIKKPARKFLVTAERMYISFCEDLTIDFAPVMVEYCRTVEIMRKEYLEKSEVYCEAYVSAKNHNNQGATFGAAIYAIKSVSGPLDVFYKDLNRIRISRNNSAHINVSKEPDVAFIRDYIWNSEIVKVLCSEI